MLIISLIDVCPNILPGMIKENIVDSDIFRFVLLGLNHDSFSQVKKIYNFLHGIKRGIFVILASVHIKIKHFTFESFFNIYSLITHSEGFPDDLFDNFMMQTNKNHDPPSSPPKKQHIWVTNFW